LLSTGNNNPKRDIRVYQNVKMPVRMRRRHEWDLWDIVQLIAPHSLTEVHMCSTVKPHPFNPWIVGAPNLALGGGPTKNLKGVPKTFKNLLNWKMAF
jgi:hypothetical protein